MCSLNADLGLTWTWSESCFCHYRCVALSKLNLVSLGFCFSKREIILVFALQECYEVKLDKISKAFTSTWHCRSFQINDIIIIICLSGYLTPSGKQALLHLLDPLNSPLFDPILRAVDVMRTHGIFHTSWKKLILLGIGYQSTHL